ncbi:MULTISPECIES: response regulator transcription factor [Methylobacterium]|jgi:DNA-binding response OmpR family regulator|uniref:Response regulators consisting of a CheY-like receiver domain and a winged-helix DNA-binding domain n=2 Tax=Methylobacterium TaxID=407 RepID=A0A0C6FVM6_9HYPH|nr:MULTISPECIES: response regulator transcription factor [Methylobacterium]MBK3397789.1 response regulator transcription factor [Methylobacterium ajmalii]MBK3410217.1 response regulator transcription factor [Methylobacterium ajmalii]MBK3423950.1 response regulator transcription factor [Methylobacterium ajmalii]MBZ6414573.1 response regulator transcription factor [Methylobacterium sp.]SFF47324.1 Transcriptional regulatory protein, C terminal [Methylobacterium sp. yr596]
MYFLVDTRKSVNAGFKAGFDREGVSSFSLSPEEFTSWIESASRSDLDAVQGFLLGDFDERARCASTIRRQSRAPIIALADSRSLEQTLVLFDAGIDDVLPKPVHVREILARAEAIWRRVNGAPEPAPDCAVADPEEPQGDTTPSRPERLKVFFDGRDPEIDGAPVSLPRRERHILEFLVRNRGRRVTKTQLFNGVYGVYSDGVEESVVEGHVSKLRKKLAHALGHDPIEAKRYIGYTYVG